jgi:broad specificity phosphatase PhoE
MSLRVFVVRHGETEWTRARRFTGARDIPLSEDGRRQCEAVARALAGSQAAAVYASPMERARGSAEVIAKPHRLGVETDAAFREMGFGDWEGLTREEVATRFAGEHEVWRTTPERFARPGAEPLATVAARVAAGLAALRAAHADTSVILVTHAIVVRLIVLSALGLGPERLWTVDAAPAGISELEYRDDWVTVHRMNTVSHLAEAEGGA